MYNIVLLVPTPVEEVTNNLLRICLDMSTFGHVLEKVLLLEANEVILSNVSMWQLVDRWFLCMHCSFTIHLRSEDFFREEKTSNKQQRERDR